MKIYSYRIKINENLQRNVQQNPFINSKNKNIEHFDDDDELVEMNKQLKKSLKKITTL